MRLKTAQCKWACSRTNVSCRGSNSMATVYGCDQSCCGPRPAIGHCVASIVCYISMLTLLLKCGHLGLQSHHAVRTFLERHTFYKICSSRHQCCNIVRILFILNGMRHFHWHQMFGGNRMKCSPNNCDEELVFKVT